MRFDPLELAGVKIVRIDRRSDERGFFARTFCAREFTDAGLPAKAVQTSISYNQRAGTVRGMHFQWPPSREGKLIRCIRGRVHDVLLDLRPQSASYLRHVAVTLDDESRDAVYVPPGIAHGFQTLVERTEVFYQMTDYYEPELAGGVRWSDPAFGIRWPLRASVISDRDAAYPDFERREFEARLEQHAARTPA